MQALFRITLDQHIGVRIPGGQPNSFNHLPFLAFPTKPLSILKLLGVVRDETGNVVVWELNGHGQFAAIQNAIA
jgi:hypothetical protein